jgi:hypothetical protein
LNILCCQWRGNIDAGKVKGLVRLGKDSKRQAKTDKTKIELYKFHYLVIRFAIICIIPVLTIFKSQILACEAQFSFENKNYFNTFLKVPFHEKLIHPCHQA